MTVSHRRPRGDGALHDESLYGQHADGSTVIRKGVADLSLSGLEDIIDPVVRQRVIAAAAGREPKIAFANENWPTMPSGVPIKRVRITKSDVVVAVARGARERLVKPNGNSHLELFVKDDGSRVQWRIVTRLDAYRRRAANAPVIDRTPPTDGWRYVGVLRVGDMLGKTTTLPDGRTVRETLVLENISQATLEAKRHEDARPAAVRRKTPGSRIYISSASFIRESLNRQSIDALGSCRPSNA
jgi:hypothetical protein